MNMTLKRRTFPLLIPAQGPEGSPYEGYAVKVLLTFPSTYPFKPPRIKFATKLYHPNVNDDDGSVCDEAFHLDAKSWGPTLDAGHIIRVIYGALGMPNDESPINAEAGRMFRDNKELWKKTAKSTLEKYGAKSW